MDSMISTAITGIGATALIDAWAIMRKPLLGVPPPEYGQVGRWIAHMRRGQFRHVSIRSAPTVRGEAAIGWTAPPPGCTAC